MKALRKIKKWLYSINHFLTKKWDQMVCFDYKDDEYNCGNLKFIWGIQSLDDISSSNANMWTLNDIEVDYDRDTTEYVLSIETIYSFPNNYEETKYLQRLLDGFTQYMKTSGLNTEYKFSLRHNEAHTKMRAKTIPELYANFRIFVNGFAMIYGSKQPLSYTEIKHNSLCETETYGGKYK